MNPTPAANQLWYNPRNDALVEIRGHSILLGLPGLLNISCEYGDFAMYPIEVREEFTYIGEIEDEVCECDKCEGIKTGR